MQETPVWASQPRRAHTLLTVAVQRLTSDHVAVEVVRALESEASDVAAELAARLEAAR
jgi:hypothetical protein